MSEATCGAMVPRGPGCRFAHPGYRVRYTTTVSRFAARVTPV